MAADPTADLINSITVLLTEAYVGPPNPSSTWFIDNEPNSGVTGILDRVSVIEASQSVDKTGNPGSTIAANAEHLRWILALSNAELRGEPFNADWKESWRVLEVNSSEWDRLRAEMRRQFEAFIAVLKNQPELNGDTLTGVLALLPHAAFHLGLIRQMVERVRERS